MKLLGSILSVHSGIVIPAGQKTLSPEFVRTVRPCKLDCEVSQPANLRRVGPLVGVGVKGISLSSTMGPSAVLTANETVALGVTLMFVFVWLV